METSPAHGVPIGRILAVMIAVSLSSVGALGLLAFQTTEVFETHMNTLNDENLEVIAALADATVTLQSAHLSFTIHVMHFGMPDSSAYLATMVERQWNFSGFLQLYESRYTFASLPRLNDVLVGEGREDLLLEEELVFTELDTHFAIYEDVTDQTEILLNSGQEQAAENSTMNATMLMEQIGGGMASLIDCKDQASQLLEEFVDAEIQRRATTTVVAASLLALFVVLVPLAIYWTYFRSSRTPHS